MTSEPDKFLPFGLTWESRNQSEDFQMEDVQHENKSDESIKGGQFNFDSADTCGNSVPVEESYCIDSREEDRSSDTGSLRSSQTNENHGPENHHPAFTSSGLYVRRGSSTESSEVSDNSLRLRFRETAINLSFNDYRRSSGVDPVDLPISDKTFSGHDNQEEHHQDAKPKSLQDTAPEHSVPPKSPAVLSEASNQSSFGSAYQHKILADHLTNLTFIGEKPISISSSKIREAGIPFADAPIYTTKHKKGLRKPEKWYRQWSTRSIIITSTGMVLFAALTVGLAVGLYVQKLNERNAGLTPTWRPGIGNTWQIQLSGPIKQPSLLAYVYNIDLFDNSAKQISDLHAIGRRVICYFSAGTYENWRPDAKSFVSGVIGGALPSWAGENWLDTRAQSVRDIMVQRMQMAQQKGCDGVDPDNVDGFANSGTTGFPLTLDDGVSYVRFIAEQAHAFGLAVGLKNSPQLINQTLDVLDWSVTESCAEYNECPLFHPFIQAGKPVFHIEYSDMANVTVLKKACNAPGMLGFSTLIKRADLDSWSISCPFGDPNYALD